MLNIEDKEPYENKYAFVNKFLVRHNGDYLDVYELTFKDGKLVEGESVDHFNKIKRIKLANFIKGDELKRLSTVSRYS